MEELSALAREMGLNDNSHRDENLLTLLMERISPKISIDTKKKALHYRRNNYILGEIIIKNLLRNLSWQFF